jgi:hypothetical protein
MLVVSAGVEKMRHEEKALKFAFVVVVAGTRPLVTIAEVRHWLRHPR